METRTDSSRTDGPRSGGARAASRPARPAPHADLVLALGQGRATVETAGGKAARLDEMTAAGLPVPPAFCLTTGLFDLFLRETGLAAELRAAEARGADSGTLRDLVLSREIPEALARTVLAAYEELGRPRVAVRSSACREDSAAQSFAGQHDTVLDVSGEEALLAAVRTCWASLWSDRAAAYRENGAAGSIAVVVQEMVHADVSGVLFTVDPVGGRPHRLVVEACCGLGEGLVSGRVSSDFFAIDDRTLEVVEERVRYKVTKCASVTPGTIGMTKVDAADRDAPCLTGEQLTALARLALDVRAHYGTEQDIEWALRDGVLHLLQTRPITTRPRDTPREEPHSPYVSPQPDPVRKGTLWSRMDIGEIFVGLMSPSASASPATTSSTSTATAPPPSASATPATSACTWATSRATSTSTSPTPPTCSASACPPATSGTSPAASSARRRTSPPTRTPSAPSPAAWRTCCPPCTGCAPRPPRC